MSSIFDDPFKATIAGLITILLVYFHFSWWKRSKSRAANPPQPPVAAGGLPLLGHILLLGGSYNSNELPHITLGALADKYGPIFSIRMGVHPAVVVSSWELAKECFTTHDAIISSRPKYTAAKILGQNYANFGFAPYGTFWRQMRKITATELLSSRRLELLKYIKESELQISIKELYQTWVKRKDPSDTVLVEMKQWFADINLNVILRMVACKRCSAESAESLEEARHYQRVFRDWFRMTGLFLLRDAIPFLRWLDLGGRVKAMERTAKELDDIMSGWLEEHRRRSGENTKQSEDFMDVMLSALEGVDLDGFDTDTVNKATCSTIVAGATDTTSVTLTWALSLLLNNRDAIQKAREELDTHVGNERLVRESDISNLVYLQAIVKETLRLYPPAPLGGAREFISDTTVGGYHVRAGTRLMVNVWKIHTDPRVWSDPLEFKPERFLHTHRDLDVRGQNFELIPFGAGRRQCPGVSLGIQMTHMALAGLLQAFEITTPSDAPVDMRATFGLTNAKTTPLQILVKPRLRSFVYV